MRPDYFSKNSECLWIENLELSEICKEVQTPFYIYSQASIEAAANSYLKNAGNTDLICYSVKANSNINLLKILAQLGMGFDVVSVGELKRALKAGATANKIVFSGVGKSAADLAFAAEQKIYSINIESHQEIELLKNLPNNPRISLRINPDMAANTHPYIETGKSDCKFGISETEALEIAKTYSPQEINLVGISAHIGSQITDVSLFLELAEKLKNLAAQLKNLGHKIDHLDVGGGLAIDYQLEKQYDPAQLVKDLKSSITDYDLLMEPGRSIVAQSGAVVTSVITKKTNGQRDFLVVDVGMNDLMRPALYSARHVIEEVKNSDNASTEYEVVGPVCETADSFGAGHLLNSDAGDQLIIYSTGAYGSSMGSNYNSRPKPAEILVSKDKYTVIRKAESFEDLIKLEEI
ncbi:diaminopimelate decarboxylase [SAR86 cluster bacterium]|nr:diaminopimelate decarboxylase [SAR86 cluster bacterium]